MPSNRNAHHRHSIRLPTYNYTWPGAYFITIVTRDRQSLFGQIQDNEMHLNDFGEIVRSEWQRSAELRPTLSLDECIVMPNHLHAVVLITQMEALPRVRPTVVGAHSRAPLQRLPRSLGSFIAGFKSATTKRINAIRLTPGLPIWQRNYYEHIVRSDDDLDRVRQYILGNPLQWHADEYNPDRT